MQQRSGHPMASPAAAAAAAEKLKRPRGNTRHYRIHPHQRMLSDSFLEMFADVSDPADVFRRGRCRSGEGLNRAALEKLPTYDRMRADILREVLDDDTVVTNDVRAGPLGLQKGNMLKVVLEDNERFLQRLRARIDRVGVEIPRIEVRFQNLFVEADTYVGTRALPTLWNATIDMLESILKLNQFALSKKRINKILCGVSGILKPSRMTLLLGPPGAGKTTLLLALAGKLDKGLPSSGEITYCGHKLSEFIPQRTCAYISQQDLHYGEMTIRETLNFSGQCMGVGIRHDMLKELSRREQDLGIKPETDIDLFMKGAAVEGQHTNLITDYVLKMLGLDICADILVGDDMRRGISGGQKKRVTSGEMLVGPAKALFMDEISTGLDSSTTYQIIKFMKQVVHVLDGTTIISLLQPAPEIFELFDDIILLSEGQIVYQGPRENVLEFFEFMGFRCPERKGIADFLQEVTSRKDQEQYWFRDRETYKFIPVSEFARKFSSFEMGQRLKRELEIPYDSFKMHPAALATKKYGLCNGELLKACFSREWLLMKRNSFIYIFKTVQLTIMASITMTIFLRTQNHHETIMDGGKYLAALFCGLCTVMSNGMVEMSMTVQRLPVFYKQRDFYFYPPWAFALPLWLLRVPISLLESGIWIILTYYVIGFAPVASRFFRQYLVFFLMHQMSLGLFRFMASVGRTQVITDTFGLFAMLIIFVLGGFIISKDCIQPWWIWAYYISPMMYGQNAISINEFLDPTWNTPNNDIRIDAPTVGKALLKSRGLETEQRWFWISIGALVGFIVLYNICFIAALTFLDPYKTSHAVKVDEEGGNNQRKESGDKEETPGEAGITLPDAPLNDAGKARRRGMVLPFQPLYLTFSHVNYYVGMPSEMKKQGITGQRLQLLCDVSGALRPGVLTALVGVSGAGKTTLMDVLAGRKTRGYTEGRIKISGYPKNHASFARISGYCEQNDVHSPNVTVYESLVYSAWLRVAPAIKRETRQMFVEEVLELIELNQLRDALVGLPGISGLSTEQRKRLTIAVELVANPSIIFMDEPTSGLDARAAAIVMRTVRNTVDTGRTVLCTIHQPSIDIFEAFDELLLMKTGGQVIYAGSLGQHSHKLIEYFEAIPGVPKIKDGFNPATWMLEISAPAVEAHLGLDFAKIYFDSPLYQKNQELIANLETPAPGSKELHFPTKYSQSFPVQCMACFWKQYWSYWRNPPYNAIRFLKTIVIAFIFGTILWDKGQKISRQQDLFSLLGGTFAAVFFLGANSASTVGPVVTVERTVFYRERAAGMYSALAYAFAQVSIEVVYIAVQSVLYSLLLFAMIYEWQVDKFLWFVYFLFMGLLFFVMCGMMTVALSPGYSHAMVVVSFFFGLWNLFCGFVVFRPQIPIWWRWCYWASPLAWTVYGVVASQLGDKEDMVEIPGLPTMTLKAFLKATLGYEHDFLPYVAVAHLGFVLLFFFIFAFGIMFLNFQKR